MHLLSWMKTRTSGPVFYLIGLTILLMILSVLPLAWMERAEDGLLDMVFQVRGSRPLDDRIVFVYLDDADVRDIGWPVTRDYFGYMTHVLAAHGARVIGLYALFDTHDARYPEYDRRLADFLETAGNVCLPATFGAMTGGSGASLMTPIPAFERHASGIGFSNLGNDAVVRRMPAVVHSADGPIYSYGVVLASPRPLIRTGVYHTQGELRNREGQFPCFKCVPEAIGPAC